MVPTKVNPENYSGDAIREQQGDGTQFLSTLSNCAEEAGIPVEIGRTCATNTFVCVFFAIWNLHRDNFLRGLVKKGDCLKASYEYHCLHNWSFDQAHRRIRWHSRGI